MLLVVAMLAVGEGSRQKVLDRISAFGTNLMLIRPGAAGIRNVYRGHRDLGARGCRSD